MLLRQPKQKSHTCLCGFSRAQAGSAVVSAEQTFLGTAQKTNAEHSMYSVESATLLQMQNTLTAY